MLSAMLCENPVRDARRTLVRLAIWIVCVDAEDVRDQVTVRFLVSLCEPNRFWTHPGGCLVQTVRPCLAVVGEGSNGPAERNQKHCMPCFLCSFSGPFVQWKLGRVKAESESPFLERFESYCKCSTIPGGNVSVFSSFICTCTGLCTCVSLCCHTPKILMALVLPSVYLAFSSPRKCLLRNEIQLIFLGDIQTLPASEAHLISFSSGVLISPGAPS